MDADLAARLSPSHIRRLEWFEGHTGEVGPRPGKLDGSLPLVHPRMGIYKPRELDYATAIVTMISSRYLGDRVTHHADGTWDMIYHQQDAPSGQTTAAYANEALRACLRDRIPVGVLQERPTTVRPRIFEILGLGLPVDWQSDYFILQSLNQAGQTATIDALLVTAEALEEGNAEERPLPADDYDARLRVLRQIVARRGQAAFRAALLDAYSSRCAVTGCDVLYVLEAAHLRPYHGPDTNDVRNGLLLRADIHTLLDLMLLAVDPASRTVVISSRLIGTDYQHLSGVHLAKPRLTVQWPTTAILEQVWQEFTAQEQTLSPPSGDGS